MTGNQSLDATLEALLKKVAVHVSGDSLLPNELDNLLSSFTTSQSEALRSKAYLILSSYCQNVRTTLTGKDKQSNPATERLVRDFGGPIKDRLHSMDEHALLIALSFFSALFKVDWESASLIFLNDGTLQNLMEVVDIIPTASLHLEVAYLFAQACSHKACRAIFTSEATEWLQARSQQTADAKVRAAAAIALIKLSKGSQADAVEVTGESAQISAKINEDDLAALMKGLIINDEEKSSVQDAIEGLAYLSVDPQVKELLSKDKIFIKKVISLLPNKKKISSDPPNNSLVYGILLLVSNICTYRPRLTEEQQHIQRLKQMTNPSNKKSSTDSTNSKSKLDEDHHVKERVRRMVDAGVLAVFPATLSYLDSPSIRTCVAKALLSIVEDKDHRGKVLQAGGAKTLILVIQRDLASVKGSKQPTKDNAPLEAIQALAKLAITSSPIQVFGANEGEMYDVIRPFSILVQHESSTLLQRFEGMMALTNLATQSPELASRIAKTEGLMNKVELLLLEDHTLVRRAAMELVCNLIVGSDDIFDKYGGGENGAKAKLHVVLALSDVDDIPTRAAASGALATLTVSPNACHALYELQQEHHRAFHILTLLIDPSSVPEDKREEGDELSTDLDLVHRGVVCVRNLFGNFDDDTTLRFLVKEAQEAGLVIALSRVVKGEVGKVTEAILQPAIEVLKRIAKYVT